MSETSMLSFLTMIGSGLLGAVLGAYASFFVQERARLVAAKERLVTKLPSMKEFRVAQTRDEAGKDVRRFTESFAEVFALFFTYRATVSVGFRGKIDRAWKEYCGTDKMEIDVGDLVREPNSDADVQRRITRLLEGLEYKA